MKILDIIVPHETLDENTFTDMMAKGRRLLKGKNAAEISDDITELLKKAGKDVERSPELAQAERALADISATVKTDKADRIIFDQMVDALADRMARTGETSLYQNNPISELRKMYPDPATAPDWLSTPGTKFKELNDKEYLNWLTNMAEAKAKVFVEIKKAPPAPPIPKTKEELAREKLEKDKLANDQTAEKNREKEIEKKKEELKRPYPKGVPRKIIRFATDVGKSLSKYDGVFAGAELSRIIVQYWQQLNTIKEWKEAQSGMPSELAKLFPPVVNDKLQVGGEKGEYKYSTEADRYEEAAKYAVDKLWSRTILQVQALGVSMFASQSLLYVGGGTAGKASTVRRVSNLIPIPYTKLGLGDILAPILRGSSKLGQMMFVDYFISVTNPNTNEENSYTAGIVNGLNKGFEATGSSTRIPPPPNFGYDPNIYNAYTSFMIVDIFGGDQVLKDLTSSGLFQHTAAAVGRGVMPIDTVISVLGAVGKKIVDWLIAVVPYLKDAVGKAPSDIPVGKKSKEVVAAEPPSAAGPPNASADQSSMSGDNSSTTSSDASQAKVPPVNTSNSPAVDNNKVPPVKTNKKLIPSDSGHLEESINKSLKRRVAQLMKS
jgi:hypothetical protein